MDLNMKISEQELALLKKLLNLYTIIGIEQDGEQEFYIKVVDQSKLITFKIARTVNQELILDPAYVANPFSKILKTSFNKNDSAGINAVKVESNIFNSVETQLMSYYNKIIPILKKMEDATPKDLKDYYNPHLSEEQNKTEHDYYEKKKKNDDKQREQKDFLIVLLTDKELRDLYSSLITDIKDNLEVIKDSSFFVKHESKLEEINRLYGRAVKIEKGIKIILDSLIK